MNVIGRRDFITHAFVTRFRFSKKMSTNPLVSWFGGTRRGNYGLGSSWPLYRGCTYSLLRYYALVVYLSHVSQQLKSQGTFYFRELKIFPLCDKDSLSIN